MNEAPLAEICEVLDAIKIDLKGYGEAFYRDVCGAELKAVLRSIRQIAKSGVHLEIVNLVVPTLNDSERMLKGLIDWVLDGDRPRRAGPLHPLPPRLPAPEPPPHAGRDAGAGAGDRRWAGGCATPTWATSRTTRGTTPTALPAGRR